MKKFRTPLSVDKKQVLPKTRAGLFKYFSSFAAVKIGQKSAVNHLFTFVYKWLTAFFLPIFTAATGEKYFRHDDEKPLKSDFNN